MENIIVDMPVHIAGVDKPELMNKDYKIVKQTIQDCLLAAKRDNTVKLLAVSKKQPKEKIDQAQA